MQPIHRNSLGLVRCVLLIIVVLLCMNAAKPYEFIGFGEVHPIYSCGLVGCECNQTIGIPRVCLGALLGFPGDGPGPIQMIGSSKTKPISEIFAILSIFMKVLALN